MKKIQYLSCCAECSAYKLRTGVIPYCAKTDRMIDIATDRSVNPALVGFPNWCPLESGEYSTGEVRDYKKEVKEILRITKDGSSDSIAEASYYLDSLIKKNS